MNLRFLQSAVAFAQAGSLAGSARALGLSHSAVSLHIKGLEDELQIAILDRTTRPPRLTDDGLALVEHARHMLALTDTIRALATADTLVGQVRIGVVPSALIRLIPPALARLRAAHPGLDIQISSGLSGQLLNDLRNRDLDTALVTQPETLPDGVQQTLICREPLDVITAATVPSAPLRDLLETHPFIWFSRRTWTGQQIERHLRLQQITVKTAMEIDSIEAIESLVANGFGIAISPRRVGFSGSDPRLNRSPFGAPDLARGLSLISLERNPRKRVVQALTAELRALVASDTWPQ
ncbi:LysR substrate-binding domain-containing protein [Oceaniglobus ichthyenteri]|uniref:LysR substrate-binding domain-containing protein n=1 Tax=Oceaniglobus ichthyenteri TaxID=2136177 RepID=UPI0013DDE5FB|nr:LysR substrate-binding domain-containing protein [Oceaniglobus ichthyenteri]